MSEANGVETNPVQRIVMCEAEKICVDVYMCFHASELTTLHEPTGRAWKLGQKLYEGMNKAKKALDVLASENLNPIIKNDMIGVLKSEILNKDHTLDMQANHISELTLENERFREFDNDVLVSLLQINEQNCSIGTWDLIQAGIETLQESLNAKPIILIT